MMCSYLCRRMDSVISWYLQTDLVTVTVQLTPSLASDSVNGCKENILFEYPHAIEYWNSPTTPFPQPLTLNQGATNAGTS